MKASITLLFLSLCLVKGVPPQENPALKAIGEQYANKGLREFKGNLSNKKPVKRHFQDFYLYLKDIQTINNELLDTRLLTTS